MPNKPFSSPFSSSGRIRLERFIRPFLRMITDEEATIQFKIGDEELFIKTIDFDMKEDLWTVNLTRYKDGTMG